MSAPMQSPANAADFRFRMAGAESADLRVTAFEGAEELSELFEFCIDLSSADDGLDPQELLGRAAALEIDGENGTRTIHGLVRRFEITGRGASLTHYAARLVPPHWLLTRRVQSRVFNEKRCRRMDVIGIVSRVLADAGLPASALRDATTQSYEPREITVQYRECDWDFVSRLLEEEGIYYYFEQLDDACRMVLVDSKDVHIAFAETADVPFREARNLVAPREYVYRAERCARIEIGAAALDDFDFKKPDSELRVDRKRERFTSLAYIDYPGLYVDPLRGARLVQTRLDEEQCRVSVFDFAATVRGFWSGGRFRLSDHPQPQFNAEYLVTCVEHRARQPQSGEEQVAGGAGQRYRAAVRAIPADVQFRPSRETPRPTVLGSQTAIVVGPPGEEIHTDPYGRVEVRFHWDQEGPHDVGASCWVRVSQGWAGGQYGMMFLPRVGQEVIVDFLEGNPDQPIITGRVYNKDHMPPYKLPDQRTISTIRTCSSPGAKGGNELRFDDKKGHEQLLLFAQNALHMRAQGDRYVSICGDANETIAGHELRHIKKSKYELVNLDCYEHAKGDRTRLVRGNVQEQCLGTQNTTVEGKYNISNSRGGIHIDSNTSLTLSAGGNFIRIDADGIHILGKTVKLNSGGAMASPEFISLYDPEELPLPAATTEFGHNVRYTKDGPFSDGAATDQTPNETSWIEIELIDELGQPCPNEAYEIILPDGKKLGGILDQLGRAHVGVRDPGMCQITFPRLDAAAWERIG